jgi:rare lipoprotein A (peptidoglycan hydrolase)
MNKDIPSLKHLLTEMSTAKARSYLYKEYDKLKLKKRHKICHRIRRYLARLDESTSKSILATRHIATSKRLLANSYIETPSLPYDRARLRKIILFVSMILLLTTQSYAYTASWYSVKSCLKEGTSGIMANGRKLNDQALTCAAWHYKFGTRLKITNVDNLKSVTVTVTDRGPAKRLVKAGRVIDLSVAAFKELAPLSKGIITITVEEVR